MEVTIAKLRLHYHALSSQCQKSPIALDATGVEANKLASNLGNSVKRAGALAFWRTGNMPLLIHRGRSVPKSSSIFEYLQRHDASPSQLLIPVHPDGALQAFLPDRLCEPCGMTPIQAPQADLLRPDGERNTLGAQQARTKLASAFAWRGRHLKRHTWIASDTFSRVDCAAASASASALFYATTHAPIASPHGPVQSYLDRLTDYGPDARVIEAAGPNFKFCPGRGRGSRRFFALQSGIR